MSKGRPRHQASRRRMYSARQRDLRERRLHAAREEAYWLSDQVAAIEIEEGSTSRLRPASRPAARAARTAA